MKRIEIRKKLEVLLPEKRFEHTLGVEYTAAALAMVHGIDVKKAAFAGLLHDCAKYMSGEEMYKEAKKYGLPISEAEKDNKELLHAKLGMTFAKSKYGVEEEDILNAIRYHTTGRPEMTELEKVLYIADYIEPNRKPLPRMEETRKEAFADLDHTMVLILEETMEYIKRKGKTMDEITLETYEYYKKNGGKL
ncbi:MAG: bis(5'-nucleosyl)-tetraphosphatase (symmetrical) YqeK [Lachnospiraceae bacterium]|nr:bis(5'-nucleosyl)-tetraphosphatase (symmetrical) YqeK [Lachnospiraceae bacterium]